MTTLLKRAAIQYLRAESRASSHAATAGAHGNWKLWRTLSFLVAMPAIGLGMVNAYLGHIENAKEERPEFVPYEHMRVRTKRFPWGDGQKSLFHNPHVNALPTGYEEHH